MNTRDEQDERTKTERDETTLTAELEREGAQKRKTAKSPKVSKDAKTWRVRVTIQMPKDFTDEMVKAHVAGHLQASQARVTRVREVLA